MAIQGVGKKGVCVEYTGRVKVQISPSDLTLRRDTKTSLHIPSFPDTQLKKRVLGRNSLSVQLSSFGIWELEMRSARKFKAAADFALHLDTILLRSRV